MSRVLIIGYGNSLRSDDAIGVRAAESLAEFYRTAPDICVVTAQQLTPEMARDIAEAGFVLFVDASADQRAGTICCEDLSGGEAGALFTHHCSPKALLDAALVLYGRVPRAAVSLTMSGESFALGQKLSLTVQAQMPKLLALAKQTVLQWVPGGECLGSQVSAGEKLTAADDRTRTDELSIANQRSFTLNPAV